MKIIDVSSKYDYDKYHLNNSINIPYYLLINNYRSYLNKNDLYYIYCKSGKLSKRVVSVLNALGYNVYLLDK